MAVQTAAAAATKGALPKEAAGLLRLWGEGWLAAFVDPEDGLHRVAQARQRLAAVGAGGVPAAVAGVDLLLGVQEEDHERDIVVELEEIQIFVIDARKPDADEPVGEIF
jgi:hypothetical protein